VTAARCRSPSPSICGTITAQPLVRARPRRDPCGAARVREYRRAGAQQRFLTGEDDRSIAPPRSRFGELAASLRTSHRDGGGACSQTLEIAQLRTLPAETPRYGLREPILAHQLARRASTSLQSGSRNEMEAFGGRIKGASASSVIQAQDSRRRGTTWRACGVGILRQTYEIVEMQRISSAFPRSRAARNAATSRLKPHEAPPCDKQFTRDGPNSPPAYERSKQPPRPSAAENGAGTRFVAPAPRWSPPA